MTPLSYRRCLWIHQYDQLAESTIEAICATARQYAGADVLLKKVFDGAWLMDAGIDRDPLALASLEIFRGQQAAAAAQGLALIPWVNATHHDQAELHAQCGDTLVIDLEPYAQFWQDGPGNVPEYLQRLRAAGVKNLFVSIDPRPYAMSALAVPSWLADVDGCLGQYYWTDFQQPESTVHPLIDALAGTTALLPAFPFDAQPQELQTAWTYARGKGATGCSLWRMGSAGPDQLRAFAALALPDRPVVGGDINVAELQQRLGVAEGKLAAIAGILSG